MLKLLNGLSKIKENVLQVKYMRFQHKFMFLTHSPQADNWYTTKDNKKYTGMVQSLFTYKLGRGKKKKKGDELHTSKNKLLV